MQTNWLMKWSAVLALAVIAMLPGMSLQAQTGQITVTGVVSDALIGEPMMGVTVQEKGTSNGATTDLDGKYSVKVEQGATLVFTYVGYTKQELRVSGPKLDVSLREDSESLEEVIVVGYGVQKKKLITGATAQVKGEALQKLNTTSPLQAMQGQTAGVAITSTSGQPGSSMKVTIRGLGTIGSSGPLYIIDGVGGDISNLNPADIESIDVLKDAASSAIYGSAGANGVVLVTTRSGRYEQKAQVSIDTYWGWQSAARKTPMLNSRQYMAIMDEQALNSGDPAYDWASLQSIRDASGQIYDTDWVDAMFKDNAQTSGYSLGINGGTAASTYAISLGYVNQEGIVGGKDLSNYERYNLRVNSEQKVIRTRTLDILKVGEQVSFNYNKSRGLAVGNAYNNALRGAFGTSPLAPIYDAEGKWNDTSKSDWFVSDGNPLGSLTATSRNQTKSTSLNANVYAELQPMKDLRLRTVIGAVYGTSEYRSFTPEYQFSPYSYSIKTSVGQSMYHGLGLTWTNTLSYDWTMASHHFQALLGMEVYRYSGTSLAGSNAYLRDGFDTWSTAYISNGTASSGDGLSVSGSPANDSRKVSYFARLGWNWKERYMINATMRADASSNFARNHRWGWFPSVSAGWTLSQESWFKDYTEEWLDQLKLRASWGQVGNASIDPYQYLAPVTSNNVHYFFGQLSTDNAASTLASNWGAYPSRLANERVTWETSEQTNIGLDMAFLSSRLTLNLDWYYKSTKDWLIVPPQVATTGTGAAFTNGGSVTNRGVEIALGWQDAWNGFSYGININGAYNKNKVGSIPNDDGIVHGATGSTLYDNAGEFYRAENGHEIGYFWGYKTAGLFQNEAEIAEWIAAGNGVLQGRDVAPGDVRYIDVNHDGAIDDADKVDLGSGNPNWTYGFSINLGWKHIDLNITANGAADQQLVQSYRNQSTKTANYTTRILDRWTGEGTSNKIPRVTNSNINWQFSDLYIQDGDYLRISNITLGYDLSWIWKSKHVTQCRVYGQVQNPFTFTKYDGMDPEVGFGNENWVSGVDYGYYPRSRTFMCGINLKF